jgi:hypothetical protein
MVVSLEVYIGILKTITVGKPGKKFLKIDNLIF